MKNERNHNIDKLFYESLGGQKIEPAPAVWNSLETHVPVQAGRSGTLLYLIAAVLIGAFTFFMHSSLPGVAEFENSSNDVVITEPAEISSPDESTSVDVTEDPVQVSSLEEADNSIENNTTNNITANKSTAPKAQPSTTISSSAGNVPELTNSYTAEYTFLSTLESSKVQVEANSTMGIRVAHPGEPLDPIFNLKDSYTKPADLLFGANFSPAVNIYPDGQNRNDYSIELLAAYEKSRFIVETGIGGNYTTESAKYQVNYTSFDSIGFYYGVNSFTVDPGNPDSVIFETSLKNLYDSIDHYLIRENTNKYAYLQIPLRVGYRVFQTSKFSVDLKVGVLFSLQVYKEVPDVPYQGSDTYNIEVIRQYPDRLTTSWQYTAGIGLNYHVNNKVRFGLEPYYRQYIKSVYSPSSEYPARSPYGFGIRGGIYFHF
jgi:hypothetical protein